MMKQEALAVNIWHSFNNKGSNRRQNSAYTSTEHNRMFACFVMSFIVFSAVETFMLIEMKGSSDNTMLFEIES